jgi:threonine dehydratase
VQEFVDDFVLVSEKQIAEAMVFALEKQRLIAEGSASVGIAALLSGGLEAAGRHVAVVVNGSTVDVPLLFQVAQNDIGASHLAS